MSRILFAKNLADLATSRIVTMQKHDGARVLLFPHSSPFFSLYGIDSDEFGRKSNTCIIPRSSSPLAM